MFSFRQKIFICYVLVFLVFITLMFPFATHTVRKIVVKAMEDRTRELIDNTQSAPNEKALISALKKQRPAIFFRVTVIDPEGRVIYDSHSEHFADSEVDSAYPLDRPEVLKAFEQGAGYNEDYSEINDQTFSFFAKSFDFHGKNYVMRTAFPYKYAAEFIRDCEIGFLGLATVTLLLFSIMTLFIIHHLTRPIQQIINAVTPYQEGKQTIIPAIKLKHAYPADEFGKLAMTLNSLSTKIQKHIDTITAERNEKSAILESLTEGVIAIDSDATIIYANAAALKLLGCEQETLIGQNFNTTQQPTCYALLISCQKEQKVLSEAIAIGGRQGKKTFVDVIASPKGQNGGAILFMQDKTSHYKLLEMRKDFIANASHELKTPITIIRGFAEALHDNPDLPKETMLEATGKIVNNCKRMTTLIKDLLTLSDIENIPQKRLIECNMYDIIRTCCDNLKDAFPDAIITIHTAKEEEMDLIADPSLIELAMTNLIENGIKYSPAPAHLSIDLKKVKDTILITISDLGIGIPSVDLEHIFERFYTVDKAHSQKMGGSGLGLSIVHTIIQKHFGHINVASEVGKGTTFTISLPAAIDSK